MKKVIALALSLIMVLALGVTSFGLTLVESNPTGPDDLPFYYFDETWDIAQENLIVVPYNMGDAGTLISGEEAAADLGFDLGSTLSSIKVESEKGIVDVTVYNLDDYVKGVTTDGDVTTKSSWPFEDFDIQDLLDEITHPAVAEDEDLNLFFVYFDFPVYSGAKVSTDNYFTLKFRENTTGADKVETSEKVWFCVYPYAVFDDDVENYADEDEAMELDVGYPMLGETPADVKEFLADAYEDVDLDENLLFVTAADLAVEYPEMDVLDEIPYVITKDAWKEIVGSTLIVGVDDDLEVEIGKIVKGQTGISFAVDTDVDDDVQAINEDAELAALLFFDTTNVLDSDFVISYTFAIDDAAKAGDYFLYELVGDELTLVQKVAVGKGDEEVDVEIERKAGDTLGQYYLSDVELSTATAEEGTEENPNTGASEVAGVAVALAVISLVSAAAVSLKK